MNNIGAGIAFAGLCGACAWLEISGQGAEGLWVLVGLWVLLSWI